MVFRAQGKSFSLTYPQSTGITKEELLDHFKLERNIEYICISEEHHQDTNPHLHCHLKYSKKKDIKNESYFDFKQHHPNIQITRNDEEWNKYIKKDNNFIEYGSIELDNLYEIANQNNHDEYFEICRKKKISFQYAKEAWDSTRKVDTTINEADEIAGHYDMRMEWFQPNVDFKSNVIIGPSGFGKTVYAKRKAAKPALFVSHIDDLKQLGPQHKSIIFDDMLFAHMPLLAQIHLVDRFEPRSIHVRYGTVKIPANIEKWFTCNTQPFNDHEAIRRRINLINFY